MIFPLLGLLQAAGAVAGAAAAGGDTAKVPLTTLTARAHDPLAQLFRFLFTTVPQEVQIAGVAIGGPVAVIAIWQAWKHRAALLRWFAGQTRLWKVAFVGVIGLLGIGAVGASGYGYHYMMHDNNFCQSCHVMDRAWDRFQTSKHAEQKCHDCHQQPIWVSTKEIYWWVLERRMAVPAHDKVPNIRCEACHVTARKDSVRTNIMKSAGHALHYSSDSSALKDLQCTTCHGTDFHKFVPNNNTCAQSGCHQGKKVILGKMTEATGLHCTMCHAFKDQSSVQVAAMPDKVADIRKNKAAADSAKRDLTPKQDQCESCHAMKEKLARFDAETDPHKAVCGTCHNPHKQETPEETYKSCATAQCHASADTLTAMHRGLKNHALDDCSTCHKAHDWKVDGKNCLACHKNIYDTKPKLLRRTARGPTAAPTGPPPSMALAPETRPRVSAPRERHRGLFRGIAWIPRQEVPRRGAARPARAVVAPPDPADTLQFAHGRHKSVKCEQCHAANDTHGQLTLKVPADCQSCHHAADAKAGACAVCHAPSELRNGYNTAVSIRVTPRKTGPVTRTLAFKHDLHPGVACTDCHGTAIAKKVERTCNSCHADHHAPARDCASCHPTAKIGHERAIHEGCASCHTEQRPPALVASRTMCLACHAPQRDHKEKRDCAGCHAVQLSHDVSKGGGR